MSDLFDIELNYRGEELKFPAQLMVSGYTVKFEVLVGENAWHFERDDEGNFRAMLPYGISPDGVKVPERTLLQAIAEKLSEILS